MLTRPARKSESHSSLTFSEPRDETAETTTHGTSSPEISPVDFLRLASRTSLTLRGAATANLENERTLLFFPDESRIDMANAQTIPLARIQRLEMLDGKPMANTPLTFPSVWRVSMEVAPAAPKKARLDTTFEDA